jgi:hypothetical protein
VRALLTLKTRTTILYRKFDFDDRVPSSILDRRPTATDLACRADDTLLLPIHREALCRKARAIACLPMILLSGWSKEIHLPGLLAIDKLLGVHIPGIHHMCCWEQVVGRQGFVKRMMYLIVWQAIQTKDMEWVRLYERLVPRLCRYDERKQSYTGKGKVIGRLAGQITSVIYALLKKDDETLKALAPGVMSMRSPGGSGNAR